MSSANFVKNKENLTKKLDALVLNFTLKNPKIN